MGDDKTAALSCDVLVVGAGIAGTTAALSAAKRGARVTIACSGDVFSGSSNFPGTWGLGLVGPDGPDDAEDLTSAICKVGRGMALPELARALAEGVSPAVTELEERGVELRRAQRADERDFIPCFDRRHRSWHGLGRESYRQATGEALAAAGVRTLPHCDLLDLRESDGRVAGAELLDARCARVLHVSAGAVVLATGGLGGLFGRTLTMPDVAGTAHAVALEHGCRLVNAEFIQIMPGLTEPVTNVVFNERTFRYAQVEGFGGKDIRTDAALLDSRAGHGPFSASLPDRAVDLAIVSAGAAGAAVSYELPAKLPEFMQTYFDWFEASFGRSPADGVRIAPYAHASNGGILIDGGARCPGGPTGLFACGEATGGMHGADRIGGLSSANGLVFGGIAGREAATWALGHAGEKGRPDGGDADGLWASPLAADVMCDLRRLMDERCLVVRTEEGLLEAARTIDDMQGRLRATKTPSSDMAAVGASIRALRSLTSASALAAAMLARRESRGAHYRADFPHEDPAQARPLVVELDESGRPAAVPLDESAMHVR